MKPIVLLVDDERVVTLGMRQALRDEPYEVLRAGSAAEALAILERGPVDVLVTDDKMPGMSGSELMRVVHAHFPDVARVMVTAYATLDKTIAAINECDVQRFLTKPYVDEDLRRVVREALERKQVDHEARDVVRMLKNGLPWEDSLAPPGNGADRADGAPPAA
jgi:DNA-binding NtrC family response regulator